MANFAKAQLLKYGWTEGKGLGKHENGIVDPLKPKLKFDTAGIGHDTKEYKWWESVYAEASSNVKVEKSKDSHEISVRAEDADAVEISTSKLSVKKLLKNHNLQYGSFLKTSTLDNGKVVPDENAPKISHNETMDVPIPLTDEELFQACGGRTAHKGARHGLKLSGKLARIAKQEAELLGNTEESIGDSAKWTEVRCKKKSKRKRRRSTDEMDSAISANTTHIDANANSLVPARFTQESQSSKIRKQSKTSRRKEKRRVHDLASKLDAFTLVDGMTESSMEAKKRKRKTNKASVKTKSESEIATKKKRKLSIQANENEKPRGLLLNKTIELGDGKVITVNNDDETTQLRKKRKKELVEADKLNNRIDKWRKKFQAKLQKRRVERLSESLMAVNLCEDSVDSGRGEDLVENFEVSQQLKKWKKQKKEKKEKMVEEVVSPDP